MNNYSFAALKIQIQQCSTTNQIKELAVLIYRRKNPIIIDSIDNENLRGLNELFTQIWQQIHPRKNLL